MKTALILGAGPAGCAAAHQIRLQLPDWKVILIEKSSVIGAGARTKWYAGHPYTFGPRHFLTKNEVVWDYMNKYCPLVKHSEHEFKTFVPQDEAFYNFPIHEDDIATMPEHVMINEERKDSFCNDPQNLEEFWATSVGPTLYYKMIYEYNKKMWQMEPNQLDTFDWSPKGAMIKSGPRAAWDGALSGYPEAADGYNQWFARCVYDCDLYLNKAVFAKDLPGKKIRLSDGTILSFDVCINTISLDDFFNNETLPALRYIGRDFYKFVLPIEQALPEHVYFIYEGGKESWTRITEYKKFTRHKSPFTLLSMETPSHNGRHYPIPTKAAQALARKYIEMFPENYYTIGRHGTYRYAVDIAVCIEMAMALVERIKSNWDHPVPMEKYR